MSNNLYAMQDPRKQYPGPPSDIEIQPAPATQQAMTEKPDCGETSYKGSGRLAGRKALLTGADSGIGRAAAIAFAREGADVAISFLPDEQDDAEDVAQIIRDAGRKAVLLPGDVAQETFCQRLVADAVAQLGGLDILVNNAGKMGKTGGLLDTTTERFDALMKTNIYSFFLDHQGGGAAHETGGVDHQHDERPGLRSDARRSSTYAITKAAIVELHQGPEPRR